MLLKRSNTIYIWAGIATIIFSGLTFFFVALKADQGQVILPCKPVHVFQADVETELVAIREELKILREEREKEVKSCFRDIASQINFMNGENCRTVDQHLFEIKNAMEQCLENRQGNADPFSGTLEGEPR